MDYPQKLHILQELYRLYDQYVRKWNVACRETCCDCCTCNVTVTTLEARHVLCSLPAHQYPQIRAKIELRLSQPRFIPANTYNQIADICASGMDVPEEALDPAWGPCPLLTDRLCPIYKARPFACRSLVSITACRNTGAAEMSEIMLTVNTVFLQVIEHVDQHGHSGNLSDVLAFVLAAEMDNPARVASSHWHLIRNAPLRHFMIPPEHKDYIAPMLDEIRSLPI